MDAFNENIIILDFDRNLICTHLLSANSSSISWHVFLSVSLSVCPTRVLMCSKSYKLLQMLPYICKNVKTPSHNKIFVSKQSLSSYSTFLICSLLLTKLYTNLTLIYLCFIALEFYINSNLCRHSLLLYNIRL